jgi:hypothetical protein
MRLILTECLALQVFIDRRFDRTSTPSKDMRLSFSQPADRCVEAQSVDALARAQF